MPNSFDIVPGNMFFYVVNRYNSSLLCKQFFKKRSVFPTALNARSSLYMAQVTV